MIYHSSLFVKQYYSCLNVLHYISFRSISALLTAFFVALFFGGWFVGASKSYFRANSRKFTPNTHKIKDNMPTMGGVFIVLVMGITGFLWADIYNPSVSIFLATLLGFGAIGCWDDWCKISKNEGISAFLKFGMQLAIAGIIGWLLVYWFGISTELSFPFFKNLTVDLGNWYIPWAMFVLIGSSNAVNLTDGLDGLAIGALMPNFTVFSIICYIAGNIHLASYLHIPFAGSAEIAVLGCALIGVSLGFLWYNTYPAQIFMGDVGSLALGAGLGVMALISKQELLLPLAGGLFVIETLSVIIQVISYKLLGRRIFKMAPIHHHFELLGWQEAKITIRFAIISLILCLCALITLKVR